MRKRRLRKEEVRAAAIAVPVEVVPIVELPLVRDSGIFCPACRYPMRVYKTKRLSGAIARERICDRCGEKQDTEELVI